MQKLQIVFYLSQIVSSIANFQTHFDIIEEDYLYSAMKGGVFSKTSNPRIREECTYRKIFFRRIASESLADTPSHLLLLQQRDILLRKNSYFRDLSSTAMGSLKTLK